MAGQKNKYKLLIEDYIQILSKEVNPGWEEYQENAARQDLWYYLGTYDKSSAGRYLADHGQNPECYDEFVFLNWAECIYYFRKNNKLPIDGSSIYRELGLFYNQGKLDTVWPTRLQSRPSILQNPVLRGLLDLCDLAALINWLSVENKDNSRLRSHSFKRLLFEGAIEMAWADKELLFDEKEGLRFMINGCGLDAHTTDLLLKKLLKKPVGEESYREFIEAVKRSRLTFLERRLLLVSVVMTSLLDGEKNSIEDSYLDALCCSMDLATTFKDELAIEVAKVLEDNPAIKSSKTNWFFQRLQRKITKDLVKSLQENAGKIWQEVQETGDLFMLLKMAAAGHQLSKFETERVQSQLSDIAKVIPALAIFMLPGGMVFLGVLLKVLPFNILPSSFNNKEEPYEIS